MTKNCYYIRIMAIIIYSNCNKNFVMIYLKYCNKNKAYYNKLKRTRLF